MTVEYLLELDVLKLENEGKKFHPAQHHGLTFKPIKKKGIDIFLVFMQHSCIRPLSWVSVPNTVYQLVFRYTS